MEIIIKSTDILTNIDLVPVRLWEGTTERGIKCKVFIHRLAVHNDDDCSEFEQELKETMQPGRVLSLRQVL
jgi:hypothetical protein